MSVSEDGSYHMGVLAGTVTGEYEAGYLGSKARERHRLAKIEECKNLILVLEEKIAGLERERNNLSERKDRLKSEYDALPGDTDLREAMKLLLAEEQKYELLRSENEKTGEQLTAFLEEIKEKKKGAIEIAEKLYLNCTYETFQSAKSAAEEYDKNLVELKSAHEMILRSAAYLRERKVHLEDLDLDMDQIRYDIRETEKQISSKQEERTSILEQLALTDYEAVKDRLDACISWLNAFPKEFQKRVTEKTQKTDEAKLIEANRISNADTIKVYEKKVEFYRKCYEQERGLFYVAVPEEITDDAGHIYDYLLTDIKDMEKTVLSLTSTGYILKTEVF